MPLLQIAEPTKTTTKTTLAAAIDLGTTHSLLAYVKDGSPRAIVIDDSQIVPSAIYSDMTGAIHVGSDALTQAAADGKVEQVIRSFKRLFGKTDTHAPFTHPTQLDTDGLMIVVGDVHYSPRVLASHLLHFLVSQFEQQTGATIATLVITVPAYFNDNERADVLAAASAIGFTNVALLSEPTAAALAYGLQKKVTGYVMVYDFGGGTFDVSLLTMEKGIFTVHAVGGDTALGGDDCDYAIAVQLANRHERVFDALTVAERTEYLRLARNCKEQLSHSRVAQCVSNSVGEVTLTQNEMNHALKPLIDRTIALCQQTIEDAGLDKSALDALVMVGGSSRLLLVDQQLQAAFDIQPLMTLDPDQVVALGAAMHAQELHNQEQGILLLDVTPLSLGIETMGGLMEVIIPRNSSIPIHKRQEFTTYKSGQTAMKISIYQGERSLVADNRLLGEMVLTDIPPRSIGAAKVAIDFSLDANGVLKVSAQETTQGAPIDITLKPTQGVDLSTMTQMLTNAHNNFTADIAVRMRTEAVFSAEQMIDMLKIALVDDGDLLDELTKITIEQAIVALQKAIAGDTTADAVRAATDDLDSAAQNFMQKRVDRALTQSLSGTKIE